MSKYSYANIERAAHYECDHCEGTGTKKDDPNRECFWCDGTGEIYDYDRAEAEAEDAWEAEAEMRRGDQ